MPLHPPTVRGPLLMVGATVCFTVMITFVKLARDWGSQTLEIMGWRALVAIPLLALAGMSWRVRARGVLLARCVFGASAMFCYFSATEGLGIGEISVLSRMQPVWVALVAPVVLGNAERADRSVWAAMVLGISGTLVLTWPTLGEDPVRFGGVLFMLASTWCSAFAHTAVRAMAEEDDRAIVFWFQLFVGAAVLLAMGWTDAPVRTPAWVELPVLCGIGVGALAGQLLMTRAYAVDTAARVATAGFIAPLLGFAVDLAGFRVWPSGWALVGAGLIGAAGVILLRARPA